MTDNKHEEDTDVSNEKEIEQKDVSSKQDECVHWMRM